ncbi:hypothetical protein D3C72_1547380 [compost metagenome]
MVQATLGEQAVARRELGIGLQQVLQVAVQEAEVPHGRQQRLQVEGLVLHRHLAPFGRAQEAVHPGFVLAEQLGDDLLLVAEVVIEVAR